ncbi:hypothetical protein TNCV_4175671 [Trichonephila clavipes]|nr:hypothetical protein TNCV_4175671 [Trichonephila clavipes]
MNDDHLRHYPTVLKFFVDNPMKSNFDSFFASSSFYWAACRLMAEMPKSLDEKQIHTTSMRRSYAHGVTPLPLTSSTLVESSGVVSQPIITVAIGMAAHSVQR